MTDKKLTDAEIIKALSDCISSVHCDECPYERGCFREVDNIDLLVDALDLINRLQAENQELKRESNVSIEDIHGLSDRVNELIEENERLNKENQLMLDNHPANTHRNCVVIDNGVIYTKTIEDYEKFLTDVSTEAYKEFAERLKEKHRRITDYDEAGFGCQIFIVEEDYIDNLLKELTNEQPPNDVKCIDCEYLEFDTPYGICSKAYKGIVHPNDCCGKGKLKGDGNER